MSDVEGARADARTSTTARRLVERALGPWPLPRAPEPGSGAVLVTLVVVACLAMAVGEFHRFKAGPLPKGLWRLLLHGVIPLAAIAVAEAAIARRGRALAVVGLVIPSGVVALRLVAPHALALHRAPLVLLVVVATGAALAVGALLRARVPLARYGLARGDVALWGPRVALALVVMVPLLVVVTALLPDLRAYYPMWKPARTDAMKLALHGLGLALGFVGWEALFRGTLLMALLRRGDALTAVLGSTVPFFLLHGDKPASELVGSLVGGIVAGWFALSARSFVPVWVLHVVMILTVSVTAFVLRQP